MPRLTRDERIKQLEEAEKAIREKKKRLLAQENTKKRKARSRRLIQLGALAEKYFNCPDIEPAAFEEFLKKLVRRISEQQQRQPPPAETKPQTEPFPRKDLNAHP